MPRGQNLHRVRQPKEVRLKQLGLNTPLKPGERSVLVRVRLHEPWAKRLLEMTPQERGEVFMAGVEALQGR
ncbi:MAG: hypothetical protein N2Z75_05930 [Meiothermus sp.]|nr:MULTISPECIES: hypothetical protein [Meiothermus]KZK16063.1 hypothetical protein A3962_07820 [Meiothermus taiwanensis]MCX7601466.1 hypothetical protein [Meiothermus sp.]GIW28757.1 MAG: hypothetical protein KatS3mg070_2120 [Meiothermus sp.]